MYIKRLVLSLFIITMIGCTSQSEKENASETESYPDIKIVGAMKNVMWKGELGRSIVLDTISDKTGLYGLGPISYLTGELLINNGKSYVARVTSDSTMKVEKTFQVSAPFFVYVNVAEWNEIELPSTVTTIQGLEQFIVDQTTEFKQPFAFKLIGIVASAKIHIQNLPKGAKVSSPEEAHQGQTNYMIENEAAEIVGFFSTEHKGIFTHHDSFLHMHLITEDETKMGHLDELTIGEMKLFLPKK